MVSIVERKSLHEEKCLFAKLFNFYLLNYLFLFAKLFIFNTDLQFLIFSFDPNLSQRMFTWVILVQVYLDEPKMNLESIMLPCYEDRY